MNFFKMIKLESIDDLKDLVIDKEKGTSLYDVVHLFKLIVLKYLLERKDGTPAGASNLCVMHNTEEGKFLDFYLEFNNGEYEVVCFDFFWSDDEEFAEYLRSRNII